MNITRYVLVLLSAAMPSLCHSHGQVMHEQSTTDGRGGCSTAARLAEDATSEPKNVSYSHGRNVVDRQMEYIQDRQRRLHSIKQSDRSITQRLGRRPPGHYRPGRQAIYTHRNRLRCSADTGRRHNQRWHWVSVFCHA